MLTWESVLLEYQDKLKELHAGLAHTLATQARLGLLAGGLALLLAVTIVGFLQAGRDRSLWSRLSPSASMSCTTSRPTQHLTS
jgi:hypothetical protein